MEIQPDEIILEVIQYIPLKSLPSFGTSNKRIKSLCFNYLLKRWLKKWSKPEIALVSAAREGYLIYVKMLVDMNIDPSWRNWQALEVAFFNKHTYIVEYLFNIKSRRAILKSRKSILRI